MDIIFKDRKLAKACNSNAGLEQMFSDVRAKKLRQRLDELRAANSLDDVLRVPPARCHELKGNRKGQISVDLDHPYRLIFVVANDPIPTKPDGGLDWAQVTAIEIIGTEDTHE